MLSKATMTKINIFSVLTITFYSNLNFMGLQQSFPSIFRR